MHKAKVIKTLDEEPLAYGFLIVSKARDDNNILKDFVDSQDDIITEDAARIAMQKYMAGEDRYVLDSHNSEPIGKMVFAFPFVSEIIKSLDIPLDAVPCTGILVGASILPEYIDLYRDGTYESFSVGGYIPS